MSEISLYWFRQDLRLTDNPALHEAVKSDKTIAIYIHDEKYPIGSASKLWLSKSLKKLDESLNNKLNIYKGSPKDIIEKLTKENNITNVYWNRCYDKYSIKRDSEIKKLLQNNDIDVKTFNGSLLLEPWQCLKDDNTHYKVFTAFYKKLIQIKPYVPNLSKANVINLIKLENSISLENLELTKPKHSWQRIINFWEVGEKAAQLKLEEFIEDKINNYKEARDYPSMDSTSKLSPHLHFGEISPSQIFNAIYQNNVSSNHEHFIRELTWRDFSYYLMYYYPDFDTKNINEKFDNFEWDNNLKLLKRWQEGQTGIPIVDAGMRELWQTGYMHNRVRMIVASFLVKNCLIHWKYGEEWFFDCLFDADIANNCASWQWVAGCGMDAAPYFRIFNPALQAQKFDSKGDYIRKYVPEISKLPNKYLAEPWTTKPEILEKANIQLGKTYPYPIVDLKTSREKALEQYKKL
ncbi:cryptochrome/photolyase family protein [Pseudofrancisella aestuarii]|uniref:Cryptochrome/photolyase family protein n=1 Tax=Pseudofrancisella aestuarii TaxID=2670347 RepID=A0ABV9T986_9GAMM|nr:deoxyribodipyrimidine photo-lyase [Pseudofrancisella aestuarii]